MAERIAASATLTVRQGLTLTCFPRRALVPAPKVHTSVGVIAVDEIHRWPARATGSFGRPKLAAPTACGGAEAAGLVAGVSGAVVIEVSFGSA
jgi:hypothetical protein